MNPWKFRKCLFNSLILQSFFKSALSGLTLFFATDSLLKIMKNAFCFTLKKLFLSSRYLKLVSAIFIKFLFFHQKRTFRSDAIFCNWQPFENNEKCFLFHLKKALFVVKIFKACVRYFYQIFIFPPNDSLLKTMKNVFYFI